MSDSLEREMADAIRKGAARDAEQRGTGRHRAEVLSTDPLRLDVLGLDLILEPADLTLARMSVPPSAGDVVVVLEVDEDEWSVLGVEPGDDEPEPEDLATQAELDAVAAAVDERLDALEAAPEALRPVGGGGQPAFATGWDNFDSVRPLTFYRHQGRVYIQGIIKSGTVGSPIFTLPTGYRPANADASNPLTFPVDSNAAYGRLFVFGDGVVTLGAGSNIYANLNGIDFRHA